MEHRYAKNSYGVIVDIKDVIKNDKEDFLCLGCNSQLFPRKGDINVHHFSHKPGSGCNKETYLHSLGKLKFYKTYLSCLSDRVPFYINWEEEQTCNSCEDIKGINRFCSLKPIPKQVDLTKSFDQVFLEKSFGEFRPDILLKSSIRQKVLFIEIAVTHFSSDKKLNSKHPIVELYISNEDDLDFLDTAHISLNINECSFYNFKSLRKFQNFNSPASCKKQFTFFVSDENNIPSISARSVADVLEGRKNETINHSCLVPESEVRNTEYPNDLLEKYITIARQEGFTIPNCLNCRHLKSGPSHFDFTYRECTLLNKQIKDVCEGKNCNTFST